MATNVMVKGRQVDPTKSSARTPEVEAEVISMICLMAGVVLLSFLLGGPINIQDIGAFAGP
jgi:hypothetical protein